MASFGVLLEKLKMPHPTLQRHAVQSIFELLKSGPPHQALPSQSGLQALSECMVLATASLPALDEAVSQLCSLIIGNEGVKDEDVVLSQLQVALECAPSEAVPLIVRSIGFTCRHFLKHSSVTLQRCISYESHPFIKAFKSRQESQLEIVQEVITLVASNDLLKDVDSWRFLQPVVHYILLNPSTNSELNDVARDLYFGLASLIPLRFSTGRLLIKLLVHICLHCPNQSAQEADRLLINLREMVDAFEGLVTLMSTGSEIDFCKKIMGGIVVLLVEVCHERKRSGLSSLPILELLIRVVKLQKHFDATHFWRWRIHSLAYLLSMADIKDEQLALLCLAKDALRKIDLDGKESLIDSREALPFVLVWVFPVVNVLPTSCALLKDVATSLLSDLEELLVLYWIQKGTPTPSMMNDINAAISYGWFADNIHDIVLHLWFDREPWKTWISLRTNGRWCHSKTGSKNWLNSLQAYLEHFFQQQTNASKLSNMEIYQNSAIVSWICILVSIMLIHPVNSNVAAEVVAGIVKENSSRAFSFVPVILFYLRAYKRKLKKSDAAKMIGLMKVLPYLAVHPLSSSIVVAALQSLMDPKCRRTLQGMAIRLLSKTCEVSKKVFPHLEVILDPVQFSEPVVDSILTIARAASIYDICRIDGNCGVELILSIQSCIESQNASIKALGLQSLSWLCRHDVVDFYTAWEVISYIFPDLPMDPVLSESLCSLLQNGALDAAAYPDTAHTILKLLWKAAAVQDNYKSDSKWWTARKQAIKALTRYEVDDLNASLEGDQGKHAKLLLSEQNKEVLRECEKLCIKFLHHEFKFRQRGQTDVKHMENKTFKIISAIPRILLSGAASGSGLMRSPAAYLLLKFTNQDDEFEIKGKNKIETWENDVYQQFLEIADEINLQGNLVVAILYIDSWCPFLKQQLYKRMVISKVSSTLTITDAALHLMKVLCRLSAENIPRIAENATLALGALYKVSKTTPDSLLAPIVEYLTHHLSQEGHEYLQWSSSIALGYVCRYCGTADWSMKSRIAESLLKSLSVSDRDIVRGACALALGFLLQGVISEDTDLNTAISGNFMQREMKLFSLIFDNILNLLSIWFPDIYKVWQAVGEYTSEFKNSSIESFIYPTHTVFSWSDKEYVWTAMGLVMTIGISVVPFKRIGAINSIKHVTYFVMKGMKNMHLGGEGELLIPLTVGSLLTFSVCAGICFQLDILRDEIIPCFSHLINQLSGYGTNDNVPEELKMAACIGTGNFLSTLLQDGVHKVSMNDIQKMIKSLKIIALADNHELACLGGFIGLANVFGAGAGLLAPLRSDRLSIVKTISQMGGNLDGPDVSAPLFFESSCKTLVQDLLQELISFALDHSKPLLSCNAYWSLALIRKAARDEKETAEQDDRGISGSAESRAGKISLGNLPKESTLFVLCSWILELRINMGQTYSVCITLVSVLRCLCKAPRLPFLDWGTLLRQILHELTYGPKNIEENVYREIITFTLAHAKEMLSLQSFLDDLCDISRLVSANVSLSSSVMLHIGDFLNIFSQSRFEKLFLDCIEVISRVCTTVDSQSALRLRVSFWKGFKCLTNNGSKEYDKDKLYFACERCLRFLDPPLGLFNGDEDIFTEWSEVLECVSKATPEWVMNVTERDWTSMVMETSESQKAIFILSEMVSGRVLPSSVLMKPLRGLCSQKMTKSFQELLWIASALHDIPLLEQQWWLTETIDTANVIDNSDMALIFLGLLTSTWSNYAPILLIDPEMTIKLLPFTFQQLLSQDKWKPALTVLLSKVVALLKASRDNIIQGSPLWYLKLSCMKFQKEISMDDWFLLVNDISIM